MSEVVDFQSIKGGKKDPCLYCGGEEHAAPLACPRIGAIYICTETGCVECIEFRDPEPKLAG